MFDALPTWITSLLGQFGLADFDTLQNELAEALSWGTQVIATRTFTVGQNALSLLVSLFIALYLAFFLVRDGDILVWVPLAIYLFVTGSPWEAVGLARLACS